jgi:tetratricopeptide (TPR) repeat protein
LARRSKRGTGRRDVEPAARRSSSPWLKASALVGTVATAALVVWAIASRALVTDRRASEPRAAAPVYVRNDVCLDCHPTEAKGWATSHHAQAMAPATDATVLGDFGGTEFERDGVTSRFFRRDGRFVVHTDGSDGTPADFDVAYTFGVDPLQQYLIAQPNGHVQALTIAWDTRRRRWFHLYPDEKTPPGDALHWTGRYQSWNAMCAACHSTNLQKSYDAATDRYATTWSEIDVSCQSCHGPGDRHVAWARSDAGARGPDDGLVDLRGGAEREIQVCATCHARRSELRAAPVPGEPLYDDYVPSLLIPELYHADGQQLGEVYEYGSFRQSRMYQAGVRCTDCHDPHRLKPVADGNALCVRCHQDTPDTQRFPGLRAKSYDSPAHHFHRDASPGALCVNCHMPARNYMMIDARRDHAIRIPRPDLTVKIGTPNACAGCHADQSAEWAAAAIARWYGPERRHEAHYGEALAAGRAGRPGAEDALVSLVRDAAQPAIVRATALELLGRYGPASVPASVEGTRDPDPAVRAAAVGGLERVPPDARTTLVAPLLDDPVRAVRIEAARVLASVPPDRLDATQRQADARAMGELVTAQDLGADLPGPNLNLAVVYENQGEHALAEERYRRALRLDPDFTPARLNLARLLNGVGRNPDAERVLEDGIARDPKQGELHYSLGLLLGEENRLADAAAALGRAAELLPERARVQYNHALALQQLGKAADAEVAMTRAEQLDPEDPEIAYALAVLFAQENDWARARTAAERFATLAPGNPQAQALLERIRRQSP